MNNIETKVTEFMSKHNMLCNIGHVCVATSGGADSMALLTFLHKHKEKFNIEVTSVHVNHGIRGETARGDANHVKEHCKQHGIGFKLFDAEADGKVVPKNASEDWARNLRYGYFEQVLREENCVISTAHTLSDQTETVIFRLARGTGLRGLCGIPNIRGSFIRPFMCLTRSEVEELCDAYGIEFRTDETNLTDDYARNKIRHNVVPVLKVISDSSENAIGKTCDRVRSAMDFIDYTAKEALQEAVVISGHSFDMKKIRSAHRTLKEYIAIKVLELAGEPNESSIELLTSWFMAEPKDTNEEYIIGEVNVSNSVSIVVTNKYMTIKRDQDEKPYNYKLSCHGTHGAYGYTFEIETVTREQFEEDCQDKRNLAFYADAAKLKIGCTVRTKKEADRFKPAMRMERKLKRFISEIGVSLVDRELVPVIARDTEVIWVYGVGFTDGFTPGNDTVEIVKVK